MDEASIPRPAVPGTPSGAPPPERILPADVGLTGVDHQVRPCPECEGTGFVVIDRRYVPTTGILTVIEGPCSACRGTGEVVVFVYGGGGA